MISTIILLARIENTVKDIVWYMWDYSKEVQDQSIHNIKYEMNKEGYASPNDDVSLDNHLPRGWSTAIKTKPEWKNKIRSL